MTAEDTMAAPGPQAAPNLPAPAHHAYRVLLNGECEGSKIQNLFWYRDDQNANTSPDVTLLDALMFAITQPTKLVDKFLACVSSDYHLQNVTIDCPQYPLVLGVVEIFNSMGLVAEKGLPLNCAVCISRYTDWRTKRGRGRTRIPVPPLSWVQRSYLTNIVAHQALADEMTRFATSSAITFTPGQYSPWQDDLTHDFWGDMSSTVLRHRISSMRRRTPPSAEGP